MLSGCGTADVPQYTVSTSSTVGGQLIADVASATQGEEIVFTITPDDEYALEKLEINGGEVEETID